MRFPFSTTHKTTLNYFFKLSWVNSHFYGSSGLFRSEWVSFLIHEILSNRNSSPANLAFHLYTCFPIPTGLDGTVGIQWCLPFNLDMLLINKLIYCWGKLWLLHVLAEQITQKEDLIYFANSVLHHQSISLSLFLIRSSS